MQRISIIGNTGTGKSTLARQLAELLNLDWISLDENFWLPSWQERDHHEVINDFKLKTAGERWIMEGNYKWLRPTIWDRADTIIWLDYSLPFTLSRLLPRTIKRVIQKDVVCNGNVESWSSVFGRRSIILWCLRMHSRRHTEYPDWLARPEYAHIDKLIFRSDKQTQNWLESVTSLSLDF